MSPSFQFLAALAIAASWALHAGSEHRVLGSDPFEQEIAPLLAARCLSCHHADDPSGGLDLTHRQTSLAGGESGPAVVPGDLAGSHLWQRVAAGEMPPDEPLDSADKTKLRNWIASGAPWTMDPLDPFAFSSAHRAGYDWWSLQPLTESVPPAPADEAWCVNEIDRFVLAELQRHSLTPSPQADPRTLVRRLWIDMLGLPPPSAVMADFTDNPSPEAWQQLVDHVLASPHYGERWARHWLDVARFGESDGYEYNNPREHAWHYRDWLIRAFNADMPYDQFARMQLAGDVLEPDSLAGAAAVGFLVAGPHNTVLGASETMQRASRHDELEELAAAVGQTFLGLTVHCARCHDHKFDPITTREYYQFVACLDGVEHGERTFAASGPDAQASRAWQALEETTVTLLNLVADREQPLSSTANLLTSRSVIAADQRDLTYRVTARILPTVWAAANQATDETDGVAIDILREDGTILASGAARPGRWQPAPGGETATAIDFTYNGEGSPGVRIRLRPTPLNSGRFGGAVADLRIEQVSSNAVVFAESFETLQLPSASGSQAHTQRPVYFAAGSERWQHTGTNTIHVAELADGQHAVQLFAGVGGSDALLTATPQERALADAWQSHADTLGGLSRPTVYSVTPREPAEMRLLVRGNAAQVGEVVPPASISAVGEPSAAFQLASNASEAERRHHLASWITAPENALFSRVIVNRIWHHHFGQGLVRTPSDLGFQGGLPSHPQLLDWLCRQFHAADYSLKSLHRQILTSATYQQASAFRPAPATIDQDNRLLWRQNRRRVEAEVVRDSLLAIAGVLDRSLGGPPYRDVSVVQVPPATYYEPRATPEPASVRRTIYRWHVRGQRSGLLDTFDCPDPSTQTPARLTTTTPAQALSLWNDAFILEMAAALADDIQATTAASADGGRPTPDTLVDTAWQRVLGRTATPQERAEAQQFLERHGLPLLCRVLFNTTEFILVD